MARRTPRRGKQVAVRNGTTGRPSMLTDRTEDAIVHAVLDGNHLTTAAAAAGIAERTLYGWLEKAEIVRDAIEDDEPYDPSAIRYVQFAQRLQDARAQAEMRAVQVIERSMQGGQLLSETPLQDVNGEPVYGPDGELLYDRKWAPSDGRLALSYLGRSRPERWGQNTKQRTEVSGPNGGPMQVEHGADEILSLAERLAQVAAERRREVEEGFAPGADVVDGEVVEDEEATR